MHFPGATVSHHALSGATVSHHALSGSNCFPPCTSAHFRLAYDALREWRGERADVEYVRILRLAATTMEMEATVDSALSLLLEAGQTLDYTEVRDLAEPKAPEAPLLTVRMAPDLKVNDRLHTGNLAVAGVCG